MAILTNRTGNAARFPHPPSQASFGPRTSQMLARQRERHYGCPRAKARHFSRPHSGFPRAPKGSAAMWVQWMSGPGPLKGILSGPLSATPQGTGPSPTSPPPNEFRCPQTDLTAAPPLPPTQMNAMASATSLWPMWQHRMMERRPQRAKTRCSLRSKNAMGGAFLF